MKKARKNGNFYFIIALLVMAVLFYSSSQTYKQQSQIDLLQLLLKKEPLKEWLSQLSFVYAEKEVSIAAVGYFSFIEFFIRKFAHFTIYFLLSGSFFLTLFPKIKSLGFSAFFAWFSATGYAGMDEFHQLITQDRSPLFQDVMLDSCGALTAVFICWLFIGLKHKRFL